MKFINDYYIYVRYQWQEMYAIINHLFLTPHSLHFTFIIKYLQILVHAGKFVLCVAPFSVSLKIYTTKYICASSLWGIYHLRHRHRVFDPEPHKGHKLA